MEMQQVRYFVALADTLNFTRAADKCNVSQPALTRANVLTEIALANSLNGRFVGGEDRATACAISSPSSPRFDRPTDRRIRGWADWCLGQLTVRISRLEAALNDSCNR